MEVTTFSSINYQNSLPPFSLIIIISLCCLVAAALFTLRSKSKSESQAKSESFGAQPQTASSCNCVNTDNSTATTTTTTPYLNGVGEMVEAVAREKQTGASMMEQLVPEITTHALSYLDYPSLCRLSMTNSLMRKAANDDNAWKALYHKDFTLEQDSIKPANGWKAYYAATKTVVNTNAEFFHIIRGRSLAAMGRFWLNADYVKCFHASGEFFTGYNAVMESWQMAFNWEQGVDFQIRDVSARVLTDVAWVTMKAYVDMDTGPFTVTNVFEFHNGRWYMVHHHSSVMLVNGGAEQHNVHG